MALSFALIEANRDALFAKGRDQVFRQVFAIRRIHHVELGRLRLEHAKPRVMLRRCQPRPPREILQCRRAVARKQRLGKAVPV